MLLLSGFGFKMIPYFLLLETLLHRTWEITLPSLSYWLLFLNHLCWLLYISPTSKCLNVPGSRFESILFFLSLHSLGDLIQSRCIKYNLYAVPSSPDLPINSKIIHRTTSSTSPYECFRSNLNLI